MANIFEEMAGVKSVPIEDQNIFQVMQSNQKVDQYQKTLDEKITQLGGTPRGGIPKPMQSGAQVMETLNAPIDAAGDALGQVVSNFVDPVKNPRSADILGGLTKAIVQYGGPSVAATGARLAAKGLTLLAPGSQGGKLESGISTTRTALDTLLEKANRSREGFQRVVDKIPAGDAAPLTRTAKNVDDIIAYHKAHGIESSPVLTDAKRIKNVLDGNRGTMPLGWIDSELTEIGKKTKTVLGQEADPRYKQLFSSMASDLESTEPKILGRKTVYDNPSASRIGESAGRGEPNLLGRYTDFGTPTVRSVGPDEIITQQPKPPYSGSKTNILTTDPGVKTQMTEWGTPRQVDRFSEPPFLPNTQRTLVNQGTPRQVEDVVQPSGRGVVIRGRDEAVRRAKGIENVIDEFNDMVKTKRGMSGAQDINGATLMDKLTKDDFLMGSLRKEDWNEIKPLLTKLADTAAVPSSTSMAFGSGRAFGLGSALGGASWLLGATPGTAGMVGTATVGLDYAVGHFLMTKTGRSITKKILESDSIQRGQKLNIINQFARLAENKLSPATPAE